MATLRLVHLYPDLMSVYGDRGNVLTLVKRAEWRGIDVDVQELSLGDELDPTAVDGQELPGAGLFDVRSVPGPRRHIGNVMVETDLDGQRRTLVGFENHSGRTYLGPGLQALGR